MSHFTIMVVGNDPEKQLAPFHEYECTGNNDEFVQDVDQTEEVKTSFEALDEEEKAKGIVDHAVEWYGLTILTEGDNPEDSHKFGYVLVDTEGQFVKAVNRTNPNAKWDWYVLGGRWNNFLHTKDGSKKDVALKGEIDFESMREEVVAEATERFDAINSLVQEYADSNFETWDKVRDRIEDINEARSFYHAQPLIQAKNAQDSPHFSPFTQIDNYVDIDRDEYIESERQSAITTFAILKDGKWYERGSMGWWGCVSDEKEKSDWNTEFNKLVEGLSDDTLISIYDCHI